MPTKEGRTNIVLDDESRRMVKAIQDRYGFLTASQAIRFAIRELHVRIQREAIAPPNPFERTDDEVHEQWVREHS